MAEEFNFTEEQLAQIITGNPYVSQWYEALTTTELIPRCD